ncbi:hypothetical protein DPSP01_004865 [Paraphaeosphaeria sporulosa]|uniref:Uncharacterized protein n=1 Tax=Paraphaeosphaeria sporulosa TaxID=1460663 RepID=A0A177CNI1_9PLEO|nr:uncharacterized protein CC84DRAFT_1215516 [Paraphaeosphaeria sporulosa]OAG09073.1 hypothetical protein CC84DRAFT_1215516 [Paraphaeosphaeria sporulosa]
MGLAAAVLFGLQVLAGWIALQCALDRVGERVARVRPVVAAMKVIDNFALVAGTTLCALLVLLPSFVFVVLEVFRFVQVRSRGDGNDSRDEQRGGDPSKTITAHMERVVGIVDELDAMGERMRQAALSLNLGEAQVIEEKYEAVATAETKAAILSQTCGNVLLAVCRHSETMEKLYSAMSPEEVDDLIYCDCDEFEVRAEKVISLIQILKECMERQTDLVKTVDDLYPMIPTVPVGVTSPTSHSALKPIDSPMIGTTRGCIEDEIDDSGFMED